MQQNPTSGDRTIELNTRKACCGGKGAGPACVLSYLAVPLRFALGGLFLFAAYNKLFIENGPQLFAASVKAFKVEFLDPEKVPGLFQLAVFATPWIEIIAGVMLVVGFKARAAAGVLGGLLVMFIGLIAWVISQNFDTACGCFGKLSPFCPEKIGYCNIVQNVVLLAMALVVMLARRQLFSVDGLLGEPKTCCGGRGSSK